MEYTIRPAAAEDLPRLLDLYRAYFRGLLERGMNYELNEETLPRVLETRIRSRLILTAVAEDETGALLGFVFCSILRLSQEFLCRGQGSVGFLNDLYVDPAARRQGLARRLTAYAEDWLRENGIETLELQVLPGNAEARAYWDRQCMTPVAIWCSKPLI